MGMEKNLKYITGGEGASVISFSTIGNFQISLCSDLEQVFIQTLFTRIEFVA